MAKAGDADQRAHDFAVDLARQAGDIARKHYGFSTRFDSKADATSSPVTAADREINRLVIERCLAEYPEIGIIGEEESHKGTDESKAWICDPLDGTLSFTFGIPVTTFCLALVDNGVPQVGVVYDFHQDRLFSAIRGGVVQLNGRPLALQSETQRVVNHEGTIRSAHALPGFKESLNERKYRVLTYCSTAYMCLPVISGLMAGCVYTNKYPWDVAAVKVIAEAAGCRVTDLDGNDQSYDSDLKGALIAWPEHYDEILATIQEIRYA